MAGGALSLLVLVLAVPATSVKFYDHKCACFDWKKVYAPDGYGIKCGSAKELHGYPQADPGIPDVLQKRLPEAYEALCTNFFMKLSGNKCVRGNIGAPDEWCYTSPECGDSVPHTKMGYKQCEYHENNNAWKNDTLMSRRTPEEVNLIGLADNVDIGMLGKLSFDMAKMPWSKVEAASVLPTKKLNATHTVDNGLNLVWQGFATETEEGRMYLTKVMETNKPTIFESDSMSGGGTIVWGEKVYSYMPLEGVPGKNMGYVCLKGCPAKPTTEY